jgi:hypothetical protein
MDFLDRYLQAVKKHLPWPRQDDIIAELRANLESQLDDREEEIGRPLNPLEIEAWLKALGPPLQVAARYQRQQYLIGPAVFPTYWYVMRLTTFWVLVIYSVVNTVLLVLGNNSPNAESVMGAILRLPLVLMMTGAWITLTFAVLEFVVTHFPDTFTSFTGFPVDWAPAALPVIEKLDREVSASLNQKKRPRTYAIAVAEVAFNYIGVIWLLFVPRFPFLLFGPGAIFITALPIQIPHVWTEFYWCVLTLGILKTAWRTWALWYGTWRKENFYVTVLWKAVGLVPIVLLASAPGQALVLLAHPDVDGSRYGATADIINHSAHLGIQIVGAIVGLQIGWDIFEHSRDAVRRRIAP